MKYLLLVQLIFYNYVQTPMVHYVGFYHCHVCLKWLLCILGMILNLWYILYAINMRYCQEWYRFIINFVMSVFKYLLHVVLLLFVHLLLKSSGRVHYINIICTGVHNYNLRCALTSYIKTRAWNGLRCLSWKSQK